MNNIIKHRKTTHDNTKQRKINVKKKQKNN